MLFWQERMETVLADADAQFAVMVDSSPQFGRDWLCVTYDILHESKFRDLFEISEAMGSIDGDDFDVLFESQLSEWQSGIVKHIGVPTGIGSKRATLAHKVHNFLHSLILELGSWSNVQKCCQKVTAVVTDHGTESLLAAVPTCILKKEFLPEIGRWGDTCFQLHSDDAVAGEVDIARLFPRALWIPGPMHLLHGISGEIPRALLSYESWFLPKLRKVCSFLSSPWMMERFREQCLQAPEAQDFEPLFRSSVDASLAEWRWLSLMKCLTLATERKFPLMMHFSIDRMFFNERQQEGSRRGSHPDISGEGISRPAPDAEGSKRENIKALHDVVNDRCFWAYCHMLLAMGHVLCQLETLVWSCPCHPERRETLLLNAMHEGKHHAVKPCFMAGRIGPQLAAGGCREDFATFARLRSMDMLQHVIELTPQSKAFVMNEFGRAKTRVGMMLQSKFTCFEVLPLKLMGMAHLKEDIARRIASEVAEEVRHMQAELSASDWQNAHSQVRFFADYIDQLLEYGAGTISRGELPEACQRKIRAFFFLQINETGVEGVRTFNKIIKAAQAIQI